LNNKLKPEQLRRKFESEEYQICSTKKLKPVENIIGQERAIAALKFGLEIQKKGYNLYVAGPPGIGKMTAVKSFIKDLAKTKPKPDDWCYVNNFDDSYEPKALKLPAGKGKELKKDMKNLIDHIVTQIPKAFEKEDYTEKKNEIIKKMNQKRNEIFGEISKEAQKEGFQIKSTPMGIAIVPVKDGKPISENDFQKFHSQKQKRILEKRDKIQEKLNNAKKKIRQYEKELKEELKELDKGVGDFIIKGLIEDLVEKYKDLPEVVDFLKDIQRDISENIDIFKPGQKQQGGQLAQLQGLQRGNIRDKVLKRYDVNLFVDNSKKEGAPVEIELNPTFANLFGRIEKEIKFGGLKTDFSMIKPGTFHKANGGFIVLPMIDVLKNIHSWDSIKRTLQSGKIQIEDIGEKMGFVATKSLKPQAIPINVKVILVGASLFYALLHYYDEDFPELFKVKADFDTEMNLNKNNVNEFLSFLCYLCKNENLNHIESDGVRRMLEFSSRTVSDQEKLSTHFGAIADMVREADFWSKEDNSEIIKELHVQKAIDEKIYRSSLYYEKIQEMIKRGTILIDTDDQQPGQINGLAVMKLGDFMFGRPSRITVAVGPGKGKIVDIEREVKLGGPLHSKGVLILGGYLTQRYAQKNPLSISARIVFEQSYGGVDGDSASSAELYALLSAIAEVPIKQNIAVTGSVNQKGQVQAIGGVNQKIEGFYDVCKAKGLTGEQGVIIPHSNIKNLMLKKEVVEAVEKNKFHIWAVKTINEGIELLTGMKTGEMDKDGNYPKDSFNYKVQANLKKYSKYIKALSSKKKD